MIFFISIKSDENTVKINLLETELKSNEIKLRNLERDLSLANDALINQSKANEIATAASTIQSSESTSEGNSSSSSSSSSIDHPPRPEDPVCSVCKLKFDPGKDIQQQQQQSAIDIDIDVSQWAFFLPTPEGGSINTSTSTGSRHHNRDRDRDRDKQTTAGSSRYTVSIYFNKCIIISLNNIIKSYVVGFYQGAIAEAVAGQEVWVPLKPKPKPEPGISTPQTLPRSTRNNNRKNRIYLNLLKRLLK